MTTSSLVKAVLDKKRKRGQRIGNIPFGFTLDDDRIHLKENWEEQCVIALMVSLREQGLSYPKIADTLNRKNISPKQGTQWWPMSVSNIVKRESRKHVE